MTYEFVYYLSKHQNRSCIRAFKWVIQLPFLEAERWCFIYSDCLLLSCLSHVLLSSKFALQPVIFPLSFPPRLPPSSFFPPTSFTTAYEPIIPEMRRSSSPSGEIPQANKSQKRSDCSSPSSISQSSSSTTAVPSAPAAMTSNIQKPPPAALLLSASGIATLQLESGLLTPSHGINLLNLRDHSSSHRQLGRRS